MRPDGVVESDASVQRFYQIIQSAYSEIVAEINSGTPSTVARRKAQEAQIRQIVASADADIQSWVKLEIPTYYEQGLFDTASDLFGRGDDVRINTNFAKFHQEAIEALAQDTYASAAEGMSGVARTANRAISAGAKEQVIESLAKGAIKGDSLRKVKNAVVDALEADGLTAMVDKRGRSWDLLRYAEMLARTKLTQAQNSGVANRMVESGYDLVIVSNHQGTCDQCAPFEGKVLSVSGRQGGYMSVRDAEAQGLFHPNCRHVFSPYHEKLLDISVAWDTETQSYRPFRDVQSDLFKRNKAMLAEKLKKADLGPLFKDASIEKAKTVTIGKGDYQRSYDLNTFEAELAERRGLKIETTTGKSKAGAYQPGDGKILMNNKYFVTDKDKLVKDRADKTFYHEVGHFIDWEFKDKKQADGARYMIAQQLTRSPELREALDIPARKFVMGERTKVTAQEMLKGGIKIPDIKDADELASKLLSGSKLVTDDGNSYVQFSRKHLNYLGSSEEVFAEAYSMYRTAPEVLKKGAPKLFEYIEKLVKGKL